MSKNAAFTGAIPEFYDRHLGPVLFEHTGADLANRLAAGPGARVLEIAAGTGISTRHLMGALPKDSHLTATDLNGAMVEIARSHVAADPRLEWQVADALSLPFDNDSFDIWVAQFGVMFFPDKVAGM